MKAGKFFWLVVSVAATGILLLAHHYFFHLVLGRITRLEESDGIYTAVDEGSASNADSTPLRHQSSFQRVGGGKLATTPAINPGCLTKKLGDYKPVSSGREYHHPPVVHYAKLSKTTQPVTLIFRDFISLMSVYKFLRPKKIIIHTYGDVAGAYWEKAKGWKGVQVGVMRHERLKDIGGKTVQFIAHEADYIRLEALRNIGGLIMDFDVVIVNGTKFKAMQKASECVISKEETFLNIGFMSCIKNSSYIRRWLGSYGYDFRPHSYLYNSGYKPKHLLEDRTSSECCDCLVEDTVCFGPSNRVDDRIKWLWRSGVYWRNKTAAHYFVKSGFKHDDLRLLNADHSLGEMFRYIYNSPV